LFVVEGRVVDEVNVVTRVGPDTCRAVPVSHVVGNEGTTVIDTVSRAELGVSPVIDDDAFTVCYRSDLLPGNVISVSMDNIVRDEHLVSGVVVGVPILIGRDTAVAVGRIPCAVGYLVVVNGDVVSPHGDDSSTARLGDVVADDTDVGGGTTSFVEVSNSNAVTAGERIVPVRLLALGVGEGHIVVVSDDSEPLHIDVGDTVVHLHTAPPVEGKLRRVSWIRLVGNPRIGSTRTADGEHATPRVLIRIGPIHDQHQIAGVRHVCCLLNGLERSRCGAAVIIVTPGATYVPSGAVGSSTRWLWHRAKLRIQTIT